MSKYILFNVTGDLIARYDSDIHGEDIPNGAMEVSDELFFQTINEQDGIWVLIDKKIIKQPLPKVELADPREKIQVTAFQAHAAIARAGLYEQVESVMSSPDTELETVLAWRKANTFRRLSPTVLAMGGALGLNEQQLDDLFELASTIEA